MTLRTAKLAAIRTSAEGEWNKRTQEPPRHHLQARLLVGDEGQEKGFE